MSDHPLAGRTALVTGGAKGIGRACCLRLAQAGANVAINYLTSDQQARVTAELVEQAGVKAHLICADVTSPEQVELLGKFRTVLWLRRQGELGFESCWAEVAQG